MVNPECDFLTLAKNRRTTFEFDDTQISDKDLNYILECARWAASPHNDQPWKLIIIKNKTMIEKLMNLSHYGAFYSSPSMGIAIVLESPFENKKGLLKGKNKEFIDSHKYMAIGSILANVVTAVESIGYNSAIISIEPKEANTLLKVPKGKEALVLIAIGKEKKGAFHKPHERKPLSQITCQEIYEEK